jgi:hypothetical protein
MPGVLHSGTCWHLSRVVACGTARVKQEALIAGTSLSTTLRWQHGVPEQEYRARRGASTSPRWQHGVLSWVLHTSTLVSLSAKCMWYP